MSSVPKVSKPVCPPLLPRGRAAVPACSAPAPTRHPARRQPRIHLAPRPGKLPGPTNFPTEEWVKSDPGTVSQPDQRAWLRGFTNSARRVQRCQPEGISLRSPQGLRFQPSGRSPRLHPIADRGTWGWQDDRLRDRGGQTGRPYASGSRMPCSIPTKVGSFARQRRCSEPMLSHRQESREALLRVA